MAANWSIIGFFAKTDFKYSIVGYVKKRIELLITENIISKKMAHQFVIYGRKCPTGQIWARKINFGPILIQLRHVCIPKKRILILIKIKLDSG